MWGAYVLQDYMKVSQTSKWFIQTIFIVKLKAKPTTSVFTRAGEWVWPPTTSVAFQPYRDRQPRATLATEQMLAGYNVWKSVRNYDTIATGFGGLFDVFMSLTIYFDVKYRY